MRIKRHCFELLMIVRVEELNKGRGGGGRDVEWIHGRKIGTYINEKQIVDDS